MSLGYPRAFRGQPGGPSMYELPDPDPALWDRVMKRLEEAGGEQWRGAIAALTKLSADAMKGIDTNWGDRSTILEPSDEEPPLTPSEALALINRMCRYVDGDLRPGTAIAYSTWHAYQGLLGRGELSRRDYGPALQSLFVADLVSALPGASEEAANPGIRWPMVVTERTVTECLRTRLRALHPRAGAVERWLSDRAIALANVSKAVAFAAGVVVGVIIDLVVRGFVR